MPVFGKGKPRIDSVIEAASQSLEQVSSQTQGLAARADAFLPTLAQKVEAAIAIVEERSRSLASFLEQAHALESSLRGIGERLERGLQELQQKEKSSFEEHQRLASLDEKTRALASLESSLIEREKKLAEYEAAIFAPEAREAEWQKRWAQILAREETLGRYEASLAKLETRIVDATQRLQAAVEKAETVLSELTTLQTSLDARARTLKETEAGLSARQQSLANLERSKDQALEELRNLRSYVEETRREFEVRRAKEEANLRELRRLVIDKEGYLASYARRLAERSERFIALIEEIIRAMPPEARQKIAGEVLSKMQPEELRQLRSMQ